MIPIYLLFTQLPVYIYTEEKTFKPFSKKS